jgi:hypothetical protein
MKIGRTLKWLAVLLLVCGLAICLALLIRPAWAHDKQHPSLTDWFKSLNNSQGTPCCDGSDATRIEDVDWQTVCEAGTGQCHYQVRLEQAWWNVPDESVIKTPNRVGPALVWPIFYGTKGKADFNVLIRCFIPGSGA